MIEFIGLAVECSRKVISISIPKQEIGMTIDNETMMGFITVIGSALGWVGKNMLSRIKEVLLSIAALKTGHTVIANEVHGLSDRVSKIEPIIQTLTTNGGSSILDKITAIQRQMAIVNARVAVDWATNIAATYECDENGEYIGASPPLAALFGTSQDKLMGRGWLTFIKGQSERERVWCEWIESVKEGIPYDTIYTIATTKGDRQIRTYTVSVRDPMGTVIAFLGCATEVAPLTGNR